MWRYQSALWRSKVCYLSIWWDKNSIKFSAWQKHQWAHWFCGSWWWCQCCHILAFMVRSIACDLKYILGYFSMHIVTSFQIMPLFWKAVSILELSCNLWVCATVSDGGSANRKFCELHAGLVGENNSTCVVHKTINLFVPTRHVYFFSDAPHLLKTARNCLYNSGTGMHTRLM